MVRSMYSGVAGMKAHQTRMDVIGNNIANVNTYGFKASRATFRDMYYQNINGAAAATTSSGGINPSSVGYGSRISSVDLLMGQSTMTTTGNPLDVAITGEGFLQVMDNDGNIFYTKAGMLDIDAAGNLVDTNGYFVLGVSGNPLGQAPGSNKIQFTIPSVSPTISKLESSINGKKITITSSKTTKEGNVSFMFGVASNMPIGEKAKATISGTGITITLNAYESFADMAELQAEVNAAITKANGGIEHPAGQFSFIMDPPFSDLTGAEIVGYDYGYNKGWVKMPDPADNRLNGFSIVEVGDKFSGTGNVTYEIIKDTSAAEESYTISVIAGTEVYTATLTKTQMTNGGNVILKSGTEGDDITMIFPSYNVMVANNSTSGAWADVVGTAAITVTNGASASTPSQDLGFGERALKLIDGTEGGPQSIKDLTGIAIGADGTIIASHPVHGLMNIGRIDLATFDNPRGLQQSGNSYFSTTQNSGAAALTRPGEGGTGALASSALEMSNVDLSQEFSDMITTQRGFQACSRLITVSDTMLEELINLKR